MVTFARGPDTPACGEAHRLAGILVVPRNCFTSTKSLLSGLRVFGGEKFGCPLVKMGGPQLLVQFVRCHRQRFMALVYYLGP